MSLKEKKREEKAEGRNIGRSAFFSEGQGGRGNTLSTPGGGKEKKGERGVLIIAFKYFKEKSSFP